MDEFKVPSAIPQDLLLIQSIVGVNEPPAQPKSSSNISRTANLDDISSSDDDSIASSGSDTDSDEEIEAQLVFKGEETEAVTKAEPESNLNPPIIAGPDSDSDSDSDSSSSSDSSDDEESPSITSKKQNKTEDPELEEENDGPSAPAQSYFHTKNELTEHVINIPDIEEVEGDEQLEKVGEVLNIVDNVAIIRGVASEFLNRGQEKALDTDTLLIFEDRKVMGYIYETFGPTTQPLYQVRFNSSYPLDPEKVRVSREVFHVPQRSNFVFTRMLAALRGSDASNINDEEPADYELEFSDDEAEAEFKRNNKRKRAGSRASSVASFRQPSPSPSQMRDQDLNDDHYAVGRGAFAENSPYDLDYGASAPSRPAPKPYDDPYSDFAEASSASAPSSSEPSGSQTAEELRSRVRGTRGRGRGRGGQRGGRRGGHDRSQSRERSANDTPYNPNLQYPSAPQNYPQHHQLPPSQYQMPPPQWSYQNQPHSVTGMQYPGMNMGGFQQPGFVQPHINPMFAGQFGMGFGQMPVQLGQQGMHLGQLMNLARPAAESTSQWNGEWSVHGGTNQGGSATDGNPNAGQR